MSPLHSETLGEGPVEEERRLEVHVDLRVPVGLVDIHDLVPAAQNRCQMRESDERPDRRLRLFDELRVAIDDPYVGADPDVARTGKRRCKVNGGVPGEIRDGDSSARLGERPGDGDTDAARCPRHEHATAVEAFTERRSAADGLHHERGEMRCASM